MIRNKNEWMLLVAVLPLLLWSCLALGFFPLLPSWLGLLLGVSWAAVALTGFYLFRHARWWSGAVGLVCVAIAGIHFARTPSLSRDWRPDQERIVQIAFEGENVRVENLRHTVYREDGTVASRTWYEEVFQISDVERVDFVHEILSANGIVAHGFLSFAFSDGRYLAVSVEARRRIGQPYGPLRGLFRNYELIYVMGEETDLIGMRANVRSNPVYIYPIRATRDQAQALFRSVLARADGLANQAEFYHTISNNCVTNILIHVNEVSGRAFGYDTRILFPGLADGLLHESGLLDFAGTREEARDRFQINTRSIPFSEPREWSKQVRGEL